MTNFRLASFLLLSAVCAFPVWAYDYAVTGNGIFFYDRAAPSSAWRSPTAAETTCRETSFEIADPAGGRGIAVEECSSLVTPYSYLTVKTRVYDDTKWQRCRLLSRANGHAKLLCPKIFTEQFGRR